MLVLLRYRCSKWLIIISTLSRWIIQIGWRWKYLVYYLARARMSPWPDPAEAIVALRAGHAPLYIRQWLIIIQPFQAVLLYFTEEILYESAEGWNPLGPIMHGIHWEYNALWQWQRLKLRVSSVLCLNFSIMKYWCYLQRLVCIER